MSFEFDSWKDVPADIIGNLSDIEFYERSLVRKIDKVTSLNNIPKRKPRLDELDFASTPAEMIFFLTDNIVLKMEFCNYGYFIGKLLD